MQKPGNENGNEHKKKDQMYFTVKKLIYWFIKSTFLYLESDIIFGVGVISISQPRLDAKKLILNLFKYFNSSHK